MKLSHKEVELLLKYINPTVEYYWANVNKDVNARTYGELLTLNKRLEVWHETTLQLERE
jgi:hypothetical protein